MADETKAFRWVARYYALARYWGVEDGRFSVARDMTQDRAEQVAREHNAYEPMLVYIRAEEKLANFSCPHGAGEEDRCRCGAVETEMFERTLELRAAALRAADGEVRTASGARRRRHDEA